MVVSFVVFDCWRNRFYVSVNNKLNSGNGRLQNKDCYFNLPSSYNKYLQYLLSWREWLTQHFVDTDMSDVILCRNSDKRFHPRDCDRSNTKTHSEYATKLMLRGENSITPMFCSPYYYGICGNRFWLSHDRFQTRNPSRSDNMAPLTGFPLMTIVEPYNMICSL